MPPSKGTFIDVRDVAKAHIISFEETLVNQRLMTSGRRCPRRIDILNATFLNYLEGLPVVEVGRDPVSPQSWQGSTTQKHDGVLEFPFISLRESVIDTVGQILDAQNHNR